MPDYSIFARGGNNRIAEAAIAGDQAKRAKRREEIQNDLFDMELKEFKRKRKASKAVREALGSENPLEALEAVRQNVPEAADFAWETQRDLVAARQADEQHNLGMKNTKQIMALRGQQIEGADMLNTSKAIGLMGQLARGTTESNWGSMKPKYNDLAKALDIQVPDSYDKGWVESMQDIAGMQEQAHGTLPKLQQDVENARTPKQREYAQLQLDLAIQEQMASTALLQRRANASVTDPTKSPNTSEYVAAEDLAINMATNGIPKNLADAIEANPADFGITADQANSFMEGLVSGGEMTPLGRAVATRAASKAKMFQQYAGMDYEAALQASWLDIIQNDITAVDNEGWWGFGGTDVKFTPKLPGMEQKPQGSGEQGQEEPKIDDEMFNP